MELFPSCPCSPAGSNGFAGAAGFTHYLLTCSQSGLE